MEDPEQKNGSTALAKLLNQLNVPTLAAIMLMGGGNFFATKTTSDEQRADTLKAVREIHELHDALDDFEKRQKTMLDGNANLLRNQNQMLENQTRILEQLKNGNRS